MNSDNPAPILPAPKPSLTYRLVSNLLVFPVFRGLFRGSTEGIERVPAQGPLVVGRVEGDRFVEERRAAVVRGAVGNAFTFEGSGAPVGPIDLAFWSWGTGAGGSWAPAAAPRDGVAVARTALQFPLGGAPVRLLGECHAPRAAAPSTWWWCRRARASCR